ncbi:hypothetical protein GGX14DRAFT_560455 [Mycena pura]|uniref:Uncharacterized protein n=1 Tax=Mycena pura TaxID=153505 RepID=A0AAD6VPX0_9AGAR|nr:hypothetical protein GGX14DRAFT_560455 [Mycena pura]
MSQNVTIDDRDSILHYSGGWFREGTFNATSVGETGTLASSDITSGVNVTFVFPSPATEFFYYGMQVDISLNAIPLTYIALQRCCGGLYLICVDCDPNNRQFETINAVNPTDNGQNPPVVLFSRKFDVPATHEVILMNSPDSAFGGKSQITLDRFVLTVPDSSLSARLGLPSAMLMNLSSSEWGRGAVSDSSDLLVDYRQLTVGILFFINTRLLGSHARWHFGWTGYSVRIDGNMVVGATTTTIPPAPRLSQSGGGLWFSEPESEPLAQYRRNGIWQLFRPLLSPSRAGKQMRDAYGTTIQKPTSPLWIRFHQTMDRSSILLYAHHHHSH